MCSRLKKVWLLSIDCVVCIRVRFLFFDYVFVFFFGKILFVYSRQIWFFLRSVFHSLFHETIYCWATVYVPFKKNIVLGFIFSTICFVSFHSYFLLLFTFCEIICAVGFVSQRSCYSNAKQMQLKDVMTRQTTKTIKISKKINNNQSNSLFLSLKKNKQTTNKAIFNSFQQIIYCHCFFWVLFFLIFLFHFWLKLSVCDKTNTCMGI